jgi:L-ascorbate metabolism protein UlaG (beta-lactamase superfamily)
MASTKIGDIEITWFGHASFKITGGGLVIYTDPFVLPDGDLEEADLILVTHEHYDHCAVENIAGLTKGDTVVVTTRGCADQLDLETKVVGPGDTVIVKDVPVQAVLAYNHKIPNHPRGRDVGMIFTLGGTTIYQAGDTDLIEEMKDVCDIDVLLLPVGGTYTMDQDDAVKAVEAIRPGIVVPMHYNYLDATIADAARFKAEVEERVPGVEVRVLE